MSRHASRARAEGRCDCLACFGFRLASAAFLAGIAALMALAVVLHAGEPKPMLIDNRVAAR